MTPHIRSLYRDKRGANLLEYILIVGLVAVACFVGFRVFGKSVNDKTEAQANCIQQLDGCNGGDPSAMGGIDGPPKSFANPPFDDVKSIKDGAEVEYKPAKGTPFNRGKDNKYGEVHPRDVSQGRIGDCWFMASLAAIARKNPGVLKNGIKDLGDGKYEVTLYERGTLYGMNPVKIIVTADFPKNKKSGAWQFGQPGNNGETDGDGNQKLWPMLYEKAYAQWKGGYEKMVGGSGTTGMESITGVRSDYSKLKGLWDMSFSDFEDYYDNNALTAGSLSKDDGKGKPLYKNGTLVGNHEYYVDSIDRKNQKVTLRNPWGWNEPTVTLTWDEFKNNFHGISINKTK